MRDLHRYPVTMDEVLACLEKYRDDAIKEVSEKKIFGDMRPVLLTSAITMLRAAAATGAMKSAADAEGVTAHD